MLAIHSSRWGRGALGLCAILFGTLTLLYIYYFMVGARKERIRPDPPVELGYDAHWDSSERTLVIDRVKPDSPANSMGIRKGDRMIAVNGAATEDEDASYRVWMRSRPGESVQVRLLRPGRNEPLNLTGIFRKRLDKGQPDTVAARTGRLFRNFVPVVFVAVALVILVLRFENRDVWLLVLIFTGLVSSRTFPLEFREMPAFLRVPVEVYRAILSNILGATFYFFFAVFPSRSPVDVRFPWLKWCGLGIGLTMAGEMHAPDVERPFAIVSRLFGPEFSDRLSFTCVFLFLTLGLTSLASNYFLSSGKESRRKIRVMFWGSVFGLAIPLANAAASTYTDFQAPAWFSAFVDFQLLLIPVSFAYAVFKDRVLDIPVLLKRSARYLMVQRGFLAVLSASCMGMVFLFAVWFDRISRPVMETNRPYGVALGALFGTALLWGGSRVHRQVSSRIDRVFFRNAYDARTILEDLAATTRTVTDQRQLATLLDSHLREALQPSALTIRLRDRSSRLCSFGVDADNEIDGLPSDLPMLTELARRGEPWDVPAAGAGDSRGLAGISTFHPECLVPIPGRARGLAGVIVLGPRLSEEPYSREDKRLLASVASQAGMAQENIRLAEEIAHKLEAERRTAREMEIAAEVQSRLLPQTLPSLSTMEFGARCIQARAVGGDYYDFLDVGPGLTAFVLGDVSGKGVHAALLMANLQAQLRSASSSASFDVVRALRQVNENLWKATVPQHFATLFFAVYDDATGCLSYANCGHNPPVLLRRDGLIERLESTATVVGVFEEWECTSREVRLYPGDLLIVFSDGVTEAVRQLSGAGEVEDAEEFGEDRLIQALQGLESLSASDVVAAVLDKVQRFSAGMQSDDLTLLVARMRVAPVTVANDRKGIPSVWESRPELWSPVAS